MLWFRAVTGNCSGFNDTKETNIDVHRLSEADLVTENYDFDSDSDLEDENEDGAYQAPTSTNEADERDLQEVAYVHVASRFCQRKAY